MIKRIFRVAVCFLLICCLVINISPIKAKAVEPITAAVAVSTVVAAVLIGLGIMPAVESLFFDEVVQQISSANALADFIKEDNTVEVIQLPGASDSGLLNWLVSAVFIDIIRRLAFEQEIVVESVNLDMMSFNGYALPFGSIWDQTKFPYAFIYKYGNNYIFRASNYPWTYKSSTVEMNSNSTSSSNVIIVTCVYDGTTLGDLKETTGSSSVTISFISEPLIIWSSHNICLHGKSTVYFSGSDPVGNTSVEVADGLVAGDIVGMDQALADGYTDWSSESYTDDDDTVWWPIALGQTYEETKSYTQEQVQAGEGTFSGADTDVGTDSDVVTASGLKGWIDSFKDNVSMWFARVSLNVSKIYDSVTSGFSELGAAITSIPDVIVSGITDFFTPSENVEFYALDLTGLFPFCIPFDLYDLLVMLQADPVTPNFDFELNFGSLGSFPVSVNFSKWDDLASLLRTLEIALFIVGLGIKTRDLIGG